MYEMNSVIYASRTSSNLSREERDLSAYLATEHNYRSVGARSARNFLLHGIGKIDEGSIDKKPDLEPNTERKPHIVPTILTSLRIRKPDRVGE